VLESAHKLIGAAWGDEGTTRAQHAFTADPGLIRDLATEQACYIRGGGCTFVQVARPKPSPLTLTAARRPTPPKVIVHPPQPRQEQNSQPDPGSLDDVLGPGATA
jgi:hypothetical protein